MRVKLTRAQKVRVLNSNDVYKVMQQVLLRENKIDRSKEHFWVVCLSNSNRILLIELMLSKVSEMSSNAELIRLASLNLSFKPLSQMMVGD